MRVAGQTAPTLDIKTRPVKKNLGLWLGSSGPTAFGSRMHLPASQCSHAKALSREGSGHAADKECIVSVPSGMGAGSFHRDSEPTLTHALNEGRVIAGRPDGQTAVGFER